MNPAQVAEVVARKDEPLATFRCHGLPVREELLDGASAFTPKDQIARLANEARERIRQGAGRGEIDGILLQISVLAEGV